MPGIFGLTKREQRAVEAAITRPATETELRKRPDRVGQYLKRELDRFVFDEFAPAYIKRAGYDKKVGDINYMKGVPIPLRKEDIAGFKTEEGLSLLVIAENMAWVIGADPKFKYADEYIKFLTQTMSYKVDEYLSKEGKDAGEKEEFNEACIHFRAALCVKPYYLDAMYGYARCCRKMYEESDDEVYIGNLKAEAFDYFELLTEIHPRFAQAFYYLGYMYLNMGLYMKAKLAWDEFLDKSKNGKDRREIKTRLKQIKAPLEVEEGYTHVMAQRWEEGIRILEPYLETSYSEWWPLSYYLGVAYVSTGRQDDALKCFDRVMKLNPSHIETMLELSDIYEVTGKKEKAKKYRNKATLLKKGGYEEPEDDNNNGGTTRSLIDENKLPSPKDEAAAKKIKKLEKKKDE